MFKYEYSEAGLEKPWELKKKRLFCNRLLFDFLYQLYLFMCK